MIKGDCRTSRKKGREPFIFSGKPFESKEILGGGCVVCRKRLPIPYFEMSVITTSVIRTTDNISRKVLREDVKLNQWEFRNALGFFRLITGSNSITHTKKKYRYFWDTKWLCHILSVIRTLTTGTMLNNSGGTNGYGTKIRYV